MENHNPNHMENIPRLNRIAGQIEGIKKMIADGRYCPEIISQLRAVRSAVKAVESNILQKHLQHSFRMIYPNCCPESQLYKKMVFCRRM